MTSNNGIEAKNALSEILQDIGIPKESLRDDAFLHRDLQLDSTEVVEISLALKRQLGVKVKLETRRDRTLVEVSQEIEKALSGVV